MEIIRNVLVFLHLLGMALLIGTFMLQAKAGKGAALNKGWLHGTGLQLITGVALMGLAQVEPKEDYDNIKLTVKLVVLIVIGVLAFLNLRKESVPNWLNPTLGGLVVLNVGLAVFWT